MGAIDIAIVLAGGDPADPRLAASLPAGARVVAADSGLAQAAALGLHVDLVVGDMDSVDSDLLAEAEARAAGLDVVTAVVGVPGTARGWLHASGNEGLIKLVADRAKGVLVGATSIGPHGGEVLGMLTLAVREATPIERLRTMIYAYPTFHKGVEAAVNQLDLSLPD